MFVRSPKAGNQKLLRTSVILPTRAGAAALGLTLLIALAAFNTGTNLLYVMLATLIASAIGSVFIGGENIRRQTVKRLMPSEIHAGADAVFEFEARNPRRFFWSYGLQVCQWFEGLADPARAFFVAVKPGKSAWMQSSCTFPRRGLVTLGPLQIISSFPFGFIEFRVTRNDPGEVLVYPQLLPLGRALEALGSDAGAVETPVKGGGAGLFSIRDYAPGDPAREIHWKLSAKGTGLKVREHEREETKRALIVLDFAASPEPTAEEAERFEEAVSLAASLARHFSEIGYEVGVWSAAGHLPVESGARHLRRIYRALALVQIESFAKRAARAPAAADCSKIIVRGGGGPSGAVRAVRAGAGEASGAASISVPAAPLS